MTLSRASDKIAVLPVMYQAQSFPTSINTATDRLAIIARRRGSLRDNGCSLISESTRREKTGVGSYNDVRTASTFIIRHVRFFRWLPTSDPRPLASHPLPHLHSRRPPRLFRYGK